MVIIVIVMVHLVVRLAIDHISFCGRFQSQQHGCRKRPVRGPNHLDRTLDLALDIALHLVEQRLVHQVCLVQYDHVRAGQLVLEEFLQRAFMVERLIGLALCVDPVEIRCKAAIGDCTGINHGDHPVHRHTFADLRPVEGIDKRLRQRKPGSLDDDMVGPAITLQKRFHGRHEVVGHRAANATIGQFDDIVFRTGFLAAAFQHLPIDTQIAKLVDDQGDALAVRRCQQVADERGLSGSQEAGYHGCRDFGAVKLFGHANASCCALQVEAFHCSQKM